MDLVLPRVTSHFPRSLIWAAAVSVALHGAMLLGFFRPHLVSGVSAPASTLQARLMVQRAVVVTAAEQVSAAPVATAATAPNAPIAAAAANPTAARNEAAGEVKPVPLPQKIPDPAAKQGLTPAPAYQSAAGLDPPPRPLQDIDPEYPATAQLQEGFVVLRLLISSSGDVDEVAVVRATPPGVFEASALAAFGKAKFSPGYFLGIPVKSQLLIQVDFTPINRGGAVSGQNR